MEDLLHVGSAGGIGVSWGKARKVFSSMFLSLYFWDSARLLPSKHLAAQ